MAVDPNDIQWDDAPTPASTPKASPAAIDDSDIEWDGPPVSQSAPAPKTAPQSETAPVATTAPKTTGTQPLGADMKAHVAAIRGMLDSKADNATVKAQIMDYAKRAGIAGSDFEGDIDNALSYRSRAGHHRSATDTAFGAQAPAEDPNRPIEIVGKKRPNPDMGSFEAGRIGARESIPGADRIGAAVDGVANVLRGDSYTEGYDKSLQLRRDLADQAWDEHAGAYGTGYGAGLVAQMAIPIAGEASLARTAGQGALIAGGTSLGNTREDLTTSEGWQNAGVDAAKDAALGATLGATLHGVTSLSTRGYNAEGRNVIDAADRLSRDGLKVQPNVQQTGGQVTRAANAGFRNTPWIGAPAERHARRFEQQVQTAFERTADEAAGGTAKPLTSVADDLKDAGQAGSLAAYEPTELARLKPQYDAIDQAASHVMVRPVRSLAFLDQAIARQTARFRGDKAEWLPVIQDIRDDLAKGEISFANLRDYRTSIRDEMQQKLGDGWRNMAPAQRRSIEGVMDGLYKNATDDIHQALRVSGLRNEALQLRKVDGAYADVANTAKTLRPLLEMPAEQLAPKLERMAQDRGGDAQKLSQIMKTLGPEQRANLQASFIHTLGQQNAGKSIDDMRSFSLESFLTRWGGDASRGGMSNAAKNLLFTGQTRRDLDDLATLARSQRSYYQKWGNPSGSARALAGFTELASGSTALFTGVAAHPAAWGPALGSFVTAHVLTTPGFARALVNLGRDGKYAPQFARRMEALARRNPASATQFLGLRDAVLGNQHPNTVQMGAAPQASGDDDLDYWLSQVPEEPEAAPEPDTEEPQQPQPQQPWEQPQ